MNDEYKVLAKQQAVLDYACRSIGDRAIEGDTPAKDRIICEKVPLGESEVEQIYVHQLLEFLQQKSHELQLQLNQFTLVRNLPNVEQSQPQAAPSSAQANKPQKAKRGKPPTGSGGGSGGTPQSSG